MVLEAHEVALLLGGRRRLGGLRRARQRRGARGDGRDTQRRCSRREEHAPAAAGASRRFGLLDDLEGDVLKATHAGNRIAFGGHYTSESNGAATAEPALWGPLWGHRAGDRQHA